MWWDRGDRKKCPLQDSALTIHGCSTAKSLPLVMPKSGGTWPDVCTYILKWRGWVASSTEYVCASTNGDEQILVGHPMSYYGDLILRLGLKRRQLVCWIRKEPSRSWAWLEQLTLNLTDQCAYSTVGISSMSFDRSMRRNVLFSSDSAARVFKLLT